MGKREEIDQLRHDYALLARRIEALEQQVGQSHPSHKSFKEIQSEWFARHGDMVKCPPEKGPIPFAHPRRGVGV